MSDNLYMSKVMNIVAFLRKNILQILALVILFLCLLFTWFFFQSKNEFPQGVHVDIQEEFRRVIERQLLKNNPLIENIIFQELWTETTGQSRQIKAVFKYTFRDANNPNGEPVRVTVRGSAFINQLPSEEKKWQIGSFDVDQTELDFEEQVIVINSGESDSSGLQAPKLDEENILEDEVMDEVDSEKEVLAPGEEASKKEKESKDVV